MQTLSYSDLEAPFLNQVRQFETTEWKVKQEYIKQLQSQLETMKKTQNEQANYIHELEQEYKDLVKQRQQDEQNMREANESQQILLTNQQAEHKYHIRYGDELSRQLIDELKQYQEIHQSDQQIIAQLQNQLNQQSQYQDPSIANQPIVLPPKDSCPHDQLVKSYVEQVMQHLKKKESV